MSGQTTKWRASDPDWPAKVSHSHAVVHGRLVQVGGRRALAHLTGEDLEGEIVNAVAALSASLGEVDSGLDDLVKVVAFYTRSAGNQTDTLSALGEAIGGDSPIAVSAVPVPCQPYPDSLIELQAFAMLGAGEGEAKRAATIRGGPRFPPPFVDGVRVDEMIFVSGQSAMGPGGSFDAPGDILRQSEISMERIGAVLDRLDANYNDAVKFNIHYLGAGTAADWEPAARVRAGYFTEPGPATTGIPVPEFDGPDQAIMMDICAMRGVDGTRLARRHSWPEGHWDWPIHLPYKHGLQCGGLIFVGGQVSMEGFGVMVDPGDLERQTVTSMDNIALVLAEFGANLDDVLSVGAYYTGGAPGEDDYRALTLRSERFAEPGPISTDILLPVLAYDGMRTEIEVIAKARSSVE